MNDQNARRALENFENAATRLEEALARPADSVAHRDSALLNFQLAYETGWKAAKVFLDLKEGVETNSPKSSLRKAFQLEWLGDNESLWLEMIQDRNLIVHLYNETQAVEVYQRVREYAPALRGFARRLRSLT